MSQELDEVLIEKMLATKHIFEFDRLILDYKIPKKYWEVNVLVNEHFKKLKKKPRSFEECSNDSLMREINKMEKQQKHGK